MICPYLFERETIIDENGMQTIKEKHIECDKGNCPYYDKWYKSEPGQGCQKARFELEREKRRSII